MSSDAPRFAILTPPGRGAIATVAVRGVPARAIVARHFLPAAGKPLESFAIGRAVFGRFRAASENSEDLVVGLVAENEIEIHCHGGAASVNAICDALRNDGCVQSNPGQWAHDSESDAVAAEALLALTEARTERTAAILLDQYRGMLRTELAAIDASLANSDVTAAASAIEQLLNRANLGLHLTKPWKVVISGPPNAGKSSLMNALLGYQRSIVWQEPGTTRDVLTATTAFDGWPALLIDTAGLRSSDEPIESAGIARARDQIAAADLVIFVTDVTAPRGAVLRPAFPDQSLPRKIFFVQNKCDLASEPNDADQAGLAISALTGQGLGDLCRAIAQSLVPDPPIAGVAIPFTTAQVTALQQAADVLSSGGTSIARQHLHSIMD